MGIVDGNKVESDGLGCESTKSLSTWMVENGARHIIYSDTSGRGDSNVNDVDGKAYCTNTIAGNEC